MRTIRRIAAIALTAGALALSTAAAAPGPEVVDPAGDARNAFDVNIDEIDIRSVDVASDGTTLTYTFQVDDFPLFQNRTYGYALSLRLPDGNVLTAGASNANPPTTRLEFRTAGLSIPDPNDPTENGPLYAVQGTSGVDRATDTVVLRFPVAAVEAESDRTGITVLGAAATDVRAGSSASTNFRTVATDTAFGGPFTIGG